VRTAIRGVARADTSIEVREVHEVRGTESHLSSCSPRAIENGWPLRLVRPPRWRIFALRTLPAHQPNRDT